MTGTAKFDRRSMVKAASLGALAAFTQPVAWVHGEETGKSNGNLKQSVCQWCYKDTTTIEKLAEEAKRIGYQSVELLGPDGVKRIQPYGLTCAMLSGACQIP